MITGYRRFRVAHHTCLVGAREEWPEREFHAKCNNYFEFSVERYLEKPFEFDEHKICEDHLTDERSHCGCGVYVLKSPDLIKDYSTWPVLAAVTGWGAFVEFEQGWRIQHVRLEHLWIEPSTYVATNSVKTLSNHYGVGVEIRQGAVCCGGSHDMAYWPANKGPILICKMETGHIVNALRYLNNARGRSQRTNVKWAWMFEEELKRRAPKVVDGKTKVVF